MAKRGRKTKYSASLIMEFLEYIRQGDTEKAAAGRVGVCVATIEDWKNKYVEFSEELKRVHQEVDRMMVQEVEKSLYKRALGYQYTEVKTTVSEKDGTSVSKTVKEVVPDVGAIVFVLTNRDPERWKNKQVQDIRAAVEGALAIDKPKIVFGDDNDKQ